MILFLLKLVIDDKLIITIEKYVDRIEHIYIMSIYKLIKFLNNENSSRKWIEKTENSAVYCLWENIQIPIGNTSSGTFIIESVSH